MKREISIAPRPVTDPAAALVDNELPKGLDLVKRIYERTLQAIDANMKSRDEKTVSMNEIKIVQGIASSLVDMEKADRDRQRHDKFGDVLSNMSEEELWKIIKSK